MVPLEPIVLHKLMHRSSQTRERIRQIEAGPSRELGHRSRSKGLKAFTEE
jgi:DNA-directed RNA polymerase sigma subunit (sigma70/sigma32)